MDAEQSLAERCVDNLDDGASDIFRIRVRRRNGRQVLQGQTGDVGRWSRGIFLGTHTIVWLAGMREMTFLTVVGVLVCALAPAVNAHGTDCVISLRLRLAEVM